MDTIVYGLMPFSSLSSSSTLVGLAGEILHAEAAKRPKQSRKLLKRPSRSRRVDGPTLTPAQGSRTEIGSQLESNCSSNTPSPRRSPSRTNGRRRAADSCLLVGKGVAIPSTNRYQIQAKFRLVAELTGQGGAGLPPPLVLFFILVAKSIHVVWRMPLLRVKHEIVYVLRSADFSIGI